MNINTLIKLVLATGIVSGASSMALAAPASTPKAADSTTQITTPLSIDNHFSETATFASNQKVITHRFELALPKGASLRVMPQEENQKILLSEIEVLGHDGGLIGTFDAPWAQDEDGQPLLSYFQIQGNSVVQSIKGSSTKGRLVTAVLTYAGAHAQTDAPTPGSGQSAEKAYVGIPSNYVYNPRLGWHHDYCSMAPDEYPNPFGANANFRGPCARHDMCYAGRVISKFTCDNRLAADMNSNCAYTYSASNPVRYACYHTAYIYWQAVVLAWTP